MPGSLLKWLGSGQGHWRPGCCPASGVLVLKPQGTSAGNRSRALAETQGGLLWEGGGQGVAPQAARRTWGWPTLLSAIALARVPGLGAPASIAAKTLRPQDSIPTRQLLPLASSCSLRPQARVSASSGRRPPLLWPLCLRDPGGVECGNRAGAQGAQKLGRGGVSGHCLSSYGSLVCSWCPGQPWVLGVGAGGGYPGSLAHLPSLAHSRSQALGAPCWHPSPVEVSLGWCPPLSQGPCPAPWPPAAQGPAPPLTAGFSVTPHPLPLGDPAASAA